MKRLVLILIVFFLAIQNGSGQNVICPPNIDFELGNFTNWYLYTGTCCPISTTILSGPIANRHTITSGATLDPYGNFPVADNSKGIFSLKLGNSSTGAQAERARYYVRIPNNANNYSLLLKYAVVMENPSHTPAEQPRFEVKAYDSSNNAPIVCSQFSFVASSVLPGFLLSSSGTDVYYKPWSMASLNLSGYAGKTIAVDFASGDCSKGKHFGYGYVDVNCVLFEISSVACKGNPTTTLTAPPGFQHYGWYDSTFTNLLDTNQIAHIATPATFNKYHVVLTAYPGYGCDDTLSTTIYTSDLFLKTTEDTFACKNTPVQFKDSAYVSSRFQPISYSWNPSINLNCSTCLNPIATLQNPTQYTLTATDAIGCIAKDSFQVSIKSDSIKIQPIGGQKCLGDHFTFHTQAAGLGNFNYQWMKNGSILSGAILDSLTIPIITYADTGNYSVWLKWGCDSVLSNQANLSVFNQAIVTQQPSSLNLCPGENAVFFIQLSTETNASIQWFKNGLALLGKNSDSLVLNNVGVTDTGFYQVQIATACDTIYSDSAFLTLQTLLMLAQDLQDQYKCSGDTVVFKVKTSIAGTVNYSWLKNGSNLIGINTDSLLILNASYNDTGVYQVVLSGACSSDTSAVANLFLNEPIHVLQQPNSLNLCLGKSALLKAKFSGANSYHWYKNNALISSVQTDSLLLNSVSISDTGIYYVIAVGPCTQLSSDTISINAFPLPNGNLIDTSKICPSYNVINLPGFSKYLWNTGDTSSQISINQTGWYRVMFTDNNNCSNTDSTYALLRNIPSIMSEPNIKSCNLVPLTLKADVQNFDSIQWHSDNKGLFSNPNLTTTFYSVDSTFLGIQKISIEAFNTCGTAITQFDIEFVAKILANFIPSDTIACEGDAPINLDAINAGGVFSGSMVKGSQFFPDKAGIYEIKYQLSANGCSDESKSNIEVVAKPIASFSYLPNAPNLDIPIVFTSSSLNANEFLWDFGDGKQAKKEISENLYKEEGEYWVTLLVNNSRCSDTISHPIKILGSNYIYAPNAFTPDGDNLNDVFKILYKNSKGGTLRIYDRYGELLYLSNNLNEGWDGTYKGNLCMNGVYFFIVDYTNNQGQSKMLSGNVTLLN